MSMGSAPPKFGVASSSAIPVSESIARDNSAPIDTPENDVALAYAYLLILNYISQYDI